MEQIPYQKQNSLIHSQYQKFIHMAKYQNIFISILKFKIVTLWLLNSCGSADTLPTVFLINVKNGMKLDLQITKLHRAESFLESHSTYVHKYLILLAALLTWDQLSLGSKGSLTTLQPSCASCLEILWASTSWSLKGLPRPVMR